MLLIAVTAIFWSAAAVRSWRWSKSPTNPALRAIAVALLAIALAVTLDLPVVRAMFAGGRGQPDGTVNLGDLGKQLAIVVGAWACQSLLLHLTRGPEATRASEGRRAALAGAVAALSTAIYLVPLIQDDAQPGLGGGIATPWITESRLLVLLYAGTVLALVARLCWSHPGGGSLGRGVAVMGAGCALMVAYALTRIGYITAAHYAGVTQPALYAAGDLLEVAGLSVIAIGTLIPWVGRLARNRRRRSAHQELGPLWELVTARVPAVVFAAAPQRDAATWELDRRVVEVQDGLVILAPHLQMPEDGTPAQRLAAALARIEEPARIVVHAEGPTTTAAGTSVIAAPEGSSSLDWLLEVSRALARQQDRIGT